MKNSPQTCKTDVIHANRRFNMKPQTHCIANQINFTRSDWQCMRLYKEHLGLNIKNTRVRARAEVSCGRYDVFPCCGGRKYVPCCLYPGGSKTFDLRGEMFNPGDDVG